MHGLDLLDAQLAHALQVDGRAPFSRLAQVLGVSDQTVGRRYTRLRSSRMLKVVGLTDPDATGELEWYVRVRATSEAAQAIARALAKRPDTSWVMLLAGGTEIACTLRTGPYGKGDDLFLSSLPRTARVLDVQASCRLHQFFGGRRGAVEKLELLRPDQIAALLDGRAAPTAPPAPVPLDVLDRGLLSELAVDGRCSLEQLAAVTAAPVATVRRRLEALRDRHVLYFDVELDNRLLARGVEAVLRLQVTPAALQQAGTVLGAHAEVAFAVACTGSHALLAFVSAADPRALYAYLTTSVASLPGLTAVESAPVLRLLKGPGAGLAIDA